MKRDRERRLDFYLYRTHFVHSFRPAALNALLSSRYVSAASYRASPHLALPPTFLLTERCGVDPFSNDAPGRWPKYPLCRVGTHHKSERIWTPPRIGFRSYLNRARVSERGREREREDRLIRIGLRLRSKLPPL